MDSIAKVTEKYAVVFNVNLLRATLNEASEFKDYLEESIRDTDQDIVVNLGNCEHLDSTFLGVLVNGYKRLRNKNRNLVIIEPVNQSSIFLTLNSIGKIFPLYTDVKSALEDIENKKLLESELGKLDTRSRKETKTKNDNSFNISAPEEQITDKSTLIDELNPAEDVQHEIEVNEIEQESLNTLTDENYLAAEELVLIENNNDRDNTNNLTNSNPTEIMKTEDAQSPAELEKNEYKNSVIIEHKIVPKEKNFSNGTVKWEFGFN